MKTRRATVRRKTKETSIAVNLVLDGQGQAKISTGIAFFDHMLELLAKHSGINLTIQAKGDLQVDYHHTVEDVGLVLGDTLNAALERREGIVRYGWALLPMDEALARVALDLGGRPYLVYEVPLRKKKIRDFDISLFREFFRALATQARMNLHIRLMYGDDPHHICEAIFKAVARALRMAVERDPRISGVPSTKGTL